MLANGFGNGAENNALFRQFGPIGGGDRNTAKNGVNRNHAGQCLLLFQRNAEFLGFFLYDLLHPFTIGFTHIRKTGSKFFDIGTDQWIRDSTHNLVCDEHEIARMESGIDSA